MLALEATGCFVFLFDSMEDRPCYADHWHESLAEAKAFCLRTCGVRPERWAGIADAPDECMRDRIVVVATRISKKK